MAITICTRQIESNPNDLESVFWRGVAYYKTGLLNNDAYLSALEDFGRVLAARPDDIDALENRAEVYLKIKYYNEAIADATRVIAIDNKSVASYMTRGIARHFTGLTQGAIEDFSKVIEFKPANKGTLRTAYFHRALIYERLGNTAVALADYKSYVAVEPNVAYPYQSLAEYYAKLGQKKEAIETWQTYIAVVERHPRYAQDDYMQKNVAKAREAIQKLSQ
jgi:tetratricopeptide (TPR) repeat protein